MFWLQMQMEALGGFIDKGGPMLLALGVLVFILWTLVFERIWYFQTGVKKDIKAAVDAWEERAERTSWAAHQVREMLISRARQRIEALLPMVATLVALAPLLGLLGTVTGMIEVFHVLAVTGGVAKATLPTMSGMVIAISGLFAKTYLEQKAEVTSKMLEDHLTMDH
ncbi:MotA/TolQ/ExbB proton channel family protein [Umboniibacter marinipuniceus]|uniref:Outer membrane transport energization protein ExbB n=1 Tax=Umboniibacter marinipuniceus TaxID=569599 RepID=A0A3M0A6H8_9GAMM|nr:MotA/TolQ/ExbB proton channel family protein [Umboniibacter marinipuniceus]RMA80206.1 outer membrane transport energization protein ExbB [Umboniibacter marinipuniceus]